MDRRARARRQVKGDRRLPVVTAAIAVRKSLSRIPVAIPCRNSLLAFDFRHDILSGSVA
jgi:hypothetical protein